MGWLAGWLALARGPGNSNDTMPNALPKERRNNKTCRHVFATNTVGIARPELSIIR
ncbi:hypothetical protein TGAM01_v210947 [Trichoderma gamsii]|uniref:Uncharacterized protein n=1 Tax=Trichoderma gamsii TaxID=398673 RepID=A0A2P4Z7C4_9HYPO|nr:hypothetical protein TGAM01_v210947 [Trichoderma gamsii]PON20191.1 hypothetical protein TGAM01_v210947 [Trichoderma gamsii]